MYWIIESLYCVSETNIIPLYVKYTGYKLKTKLKSEKENKQEKSQINTLPYTQRRFKKGQITKSKSAEGKR